VSAQTLITIHRVPDFPGPLLTPLDQFPLYYEFNSSSGEEFNLDAVVGVCTIAPDFTRLRVAHNVPGTDSDHDRDPAACGSALPRLLERLAQPGSQPLAP
jgi:hypothetical protein